MRLLFLQARICNIVLLGNTKTNTKIIIQPRFLFINWMSAAIPAHTRTRNKLIFGTANLYYIKSAIEFILLYFIVSDGLYLVWKASAVKHLKNMSMNCIDEESTGNSEQDWEIFDVLCKEVSTKCKYLIWIKQNISINALYILMTLKFQNFIVVIGIFYI